MATINCTVHIHADALRAELERLAAAADLALDSGRRVFECRSDALGEDHLTLDALRSDGRVRIMAHNNERFISAHLSPADARELAGALIALAAQAEATA